MKEERTIVLRTKADIQRAIVFLSSILIEGPVWEIVIRYHKLKRTIEQNKRYHAVCAEVASQLIIDGRTFEPDILKEYFKCLFIGTTEVVMPDGRTMQYGISTTTLSVPEFANYMTEIDAWSTEHGVIFEETRAMLDAWQEEAQNWRHRRDVPIA